MRIRKLDTRTVKRPEHALFCRVRNEAYFVPHFLAHYRALGIEHFYFADDRSDDGTRDILLGEPDCSVFEADFRYGDMLGGVQGKRILARMVPEEIIGPGWILSVDMDEFLILPEPFDSIRALTGALEARSQISCIASMVDFYPATLRERSADPQLSPFAAYPYFDAGPYFIWYPNQARPTRLFGGVRHRINEWMFEAEPGTVWTNYRPTWLAKVPLIKWGHGMYPETDHVTNIPPHVRTQVALAHFKFYPGLDAKIDYAVRSNAYYGGSYYYHTLKRFIDRFEDRSLVALVSRRFGSSGDLLNARLLYADGRPF